MGYFDNIKSKTMQRGDPKEAPWPSEFGTGEKGVFHLDKQTRELKPGYAPPDFERYGQAPIVMFDSMPATYHEAAGRVIESRKEWNLADKQHGTITFGSPKDAKPRVDKANERKRYKEGLRKASLTALQKYRANPREVKQRLDKQGEHQIEVLKKAGLGDALGLKHG